MGLAPRDGTIIEIENSHGTSAWYDIYCWRDGRGWVNARDSSRSIVSAEDTLRWRPYDPEIVGYTDPAKDSEGVPAQWGTNRKDAVEGSEEASVALSWWDRLLGLFGSDESERPIDQYLEPDDHSAGPDFGAAGSCERVPPETGIASASAP
jgi:hypothetical protein